MSAPSRYRLTCTVDEAAKLLGISRGKAYECVKARAAALRPNRTTHPRATQRYRRTPSRRYHDADGRAGAGALTPCLTIRRAVRPGALPISRSRSRRDGVRPFPATSPHRSATLTAPVGGEHSRRSDG